MAFDREGVRADEEGKLVVDAEILAIRGQVATVEVSVTALTIFMGGEPDTAYRKAFEVPFEAEHTIAAIRMAALRRAADDLQTVRSLVNAEITLRDLGRG